MRIFVTGGSGFIGKHVLDVLSSSMHELLILSIDDEQNSKILNRYNASKIISELKEIDKLKNDIMNFSPEICIHLAWEGIPDFSYEMSKKNLDNSLGLMDFLVNETSCKKIIISGSCYEYGKVFGICKESDSININSFFSWAKYSLYSYLDYVCKQHDRELVWFRIFYVYGPGQRKESLIPMLFDSLKKGEIANINSPLNANDFIYVEDVAEAFNMAVNSAIPFGIYNLGSGLSTNVIDICEIIERQLFGNSNITNSLRKNVNSEQKVNFWADTSKSREVLGWKYKTTIEEGIKKYNVSEGEQ